jgi:signal transduction histidine kinase
MDALHRRAAHPPAGRLSAHSACGGSHVVQFYEGEEFLADVVAHFLRAGFEAGEPALVIATEAHRRSVIERLVSQGVDVDGVCRSGRLVLLDARQTLAQFMVEGMPDWSRFKRTIGAALEKSRAAGGGTQVRAYGEMVDVLWQERHTQAALALEEQWNDLGRLHAFTLLCAYAMGNFRTSEDAEPFRQVCAAHSRVVPTETYSGIESEEARLLEIAALQQRARVLEEELAHRERIEQELREAVVMRDDFLSVAGHELRTPLTAVQLQVHSLLGRARERYGTDGYLLERLERVRRQTERLSGLIDELLDASRISAGRLTLEPEECDLAALVREVADRAAEAAARAGCALRVAAEAPVRGHWDRLRIEQVVSNLLGNALKYGAGKPVEVQVQGGRDRARLAVRDAGIGIPIEDQARIFRRFERAVSSRNFGGLGLGLWIVRQVVEAHGGTVRVESEPGQGATFIAELPYAGPPRA